jgi:hypothetical protein
VYLTNLAAVALNVALVACSVSPKGSQGQNQGRAPDKSRTVLEAWLDRLPNVPKTEDEGRKIIAVDDEVVRRVFPDVRFYGVYFYVNYPRPKTLPEGLRTHNLFLVRPGGEVERIGDLEALKAFFEKKPPQARDEAHAREAASACVRVAEEFYQDGLYTFDPPEVKISRRGEELVATAEVRVKTRGTGKVSVNLTFKPSGDLNGISIEGRVRPDVRRR